MKLPLIVAGAALLLGCNKTPPEKAARAYAAQLSLPLDGVACASDVDADGYVICSLTVHGDPICRESIRCAAMGEPIASRCKPLSAH